MSDGFTPIKGKCTWWREKMREDDRWDIMLKDPERRVECTCFVEGEAWTYPAKDVPSDCPLRLHCRYYIKNL